LPHPRKALHCKAFLFGSQDLNTLETVQIILPGDLTIAPCGGAWPRRFDLGEVNMHQSSLSQEVDFLPVCGISMFLLAAAISLAALFFLPSHAAARDLPLQQNSTLADWQRYAAWHPSWRYLAMQEDDCILGGS
jgi:hypothetical protein